MTFKYENKKIREGYTHTIGCDEVGRGCLAGPVVAAAVVLPVDGDKQKVIKSCGIQDSKQLLPKKRKELSELIKQNCVAWGIGIVGEKKIDEINIHNASLLAMRRAVESLFASISVIPEFFTRKQSLGKKYPGSRNQDMVKQISRPRLGGRGDTLSNYFLYLDGKFTIPSFDMKQEAVVGGDGKILSVAAASIVAKVFRDELMENYHKEFPVYNFAQHKGYATFHHRQMVKQHGLSAIHRLTFCTHL